MAGVERGAEAVPGERVPDRLVDRPARPTELDRLVPGRDRAPVGDGQPLEVLLGPASRHDVAVHHEPGSAAEAAPEADRSRRRIADLDRSRRWAAQPDRAPG